MHLQYLILLLPACLISGLLPVELNAGLIVKREVFLVRCRATGQLVARLLPLPP